MKIENKNGLVLIAMSEKDAKAFAIMVRCAVDNQETMEAEQLGVTDEELELSVRICEAMDKQFDLFGFHDTTKEDTCVAGLDANGNTPWHLALDFTDDKRFQNYKFTEGDKNVVRNLRGRWTDTLSVIDDKTLAYIYLQYSYSDYHGDNDARFLEYIGAEEPAA